MAKVAVKILAPFGLYRKGQEVSLEESRLDYLLKKGLVERTDSLPEKPVEPVTVPEDPEKSEDSEDSEESEDQEEKTFEEYLKANLPDGIVDAILEAGILDPDDVVNTTDAEFKKLDGVDSATIAKIRTLADEFAVG